MIEIQNLENQILYHKKKYYDGEPEISDDAYDALEEQLRALDPTNSVLQIVGTPAGGKITHELQMLSCQKANTVEEVIKWAKGRELFTGYKVDGLSLSLVYENKFLKQVATRGDGVTGDDETVPVMKIGSIPKTLPIDDKVNVRGELFMKLSEFQRIKDQNPKSLYASPRNLAVGTLKQKNLRVLEERELHFFAWDILGLKTETTIDEKTTLLKDWGFETADFGLIDARKKNVFTAKYVQNIIQKRMNHTMNVRVVVVINVLTVVKTSLRLEKQTVSIVKDNSSFTNPQQKQWKFMNQNDNERTAKNG